jgi:hypothetical protein
MAKCWEKRGCDDEMMSRCPHNNPEEKCPSRCAFAQCDRPGHGSSSDPMLIFEPTIDRSAAVKELCTFCAFFLTNGPKTPAGPGAVR